MDSIGFGEIFDDLIAEDVHVAFVPTPPGQLFYFLDWTDWDEQNLYDTLDLILRGQTGSVNVSYTSPEDLFLRSF